MDFFISMTGYALLWIAVMIGRDKESRDNLASWRFLLVTSLLIVGVFLIEVSKKAAIVVTFTT